ncbi:myb-binding protein 1A-like protein isoform X2 [Hemibagrus wyckioides]|uniref:myb-binding protein 1A-like protein isoform X2 n=1 Tax=Hemibagrus wyckioides TaxID=337641 RepID=UPI00266CD8F3|nr:myb-binding protein 1A-like protein isoform X2 [Hemibagrus wyckioides]
MQTAVMGEVKTDTETEPVRPKVTDSRGVLKQNREFLDYFWDIAKPERETRLRAVESLIEHVKKREQSDELKYTLKRLVDGLCHAREEARSGYSLALAQVLSVFEEISLRSVLDQIREKHNLQTASKKQIKHVAFGNFFGVLALSQSTRLHKEADVLLECVKLLQSLSQYREYLRDLPRKTMADILNEVSEQMFEQVLFSALQEDLSSALSSPEQLELLLLVMCRFSSTLSPTHLDKLLGTASIINTHTLSWLVEVVKSAARSVKKESVLPAVASDLLHVSLREDSFTFFWDKVVIEGLMSEPTGPSHYLAFRLMGVSLPLLSVSQLQYVLSGEVMRRYGEHVMTAQLPERFKFSPEMDEYVSVFLRSYTDVERQLLVLQAFSRLTHRGAPVIPSFWKVLEHVEPSALKSYTHWLKESFCQPQIPELLEFNTRKQRKSQNSAPDSAPQIEECVLRLRNWIIHRLSCIVENHQIKKDEDLVMEITRFIFFHAFFDTLKSTAEIPETQCKLSLPLDQNTRNSIGSIFFSVLHSLSVLPVLSESVQCEAVSRRSVLGVMSDGSMWVYGLVQFANTLLKHTKHVRTAHTLSTDHTQAWDSMLQSVESLSKKMMKSAAPEHSAFQHLFLIIGIQMFKAPDDSVELLNDLRSCMEQAQAKKSKKKKQKKSDADSEQAKGAEPHWVEVVVDILLSLLAQPSRLIRSVCKTAFSRVCPYLTQSALTAILNVLDPSKDEEESGVLVTDDNNTEKEEEEDEAEDEEEPDSSDDDEDEDDDDDESMEEDQEVDQNFRLELMKVLQGQSALATEEDGSEDEELDDEAMMKLDKNLEVLFGEQKKKLQAKKDEKERLRKEKTLVRDFKIKVLDLLDVFLCKQGSSVLVLGLVEPLLNVIENCMSSESGQHEQDFLRRAAHIFRNRLCRGKHYCREVEGREAELHDMLERLVGRAQKLSDSSVALYYFSAALYLVKVLRGVMKDTDSTHTAERMMGKVDVERVTSCFREALTSFMMRRKCPLTGDMFIELFNRFPVLCVNLLDTVVESITGGVREHQQAQACVMVLRALPCKEVKQLMSEVQWTEVCQKTTEQLTQTLQKVEIKNKAVHEKTMKALELAHFLIKTVHHQKLEVKLEDLRNVLRSMNTDGSLQKSGTLEDTYWSVMKLFGLQKPKVEKVKKVREEEKTEEEEEEPKKKKGFLPESKKRKNRKKPVILEGKDTTDTPGGRRGGGEGKKKRKNNKKKRSESETQNQPPVKKTKAQELQSNMEKKQKKKKKKRGGKSGAE